MKCQKYWSNEDDKKILYRKVSLDILDETELADHVMRRFKVVFVSLFFAGPMSEALSLKKYYRFLMCICLCVSFQQSTAIALEFVICLVLITSESLRLVINQKYCYSMFNKGPLHQYLLKNRF